MSLIEYLPEFIREIKEIEVIMSAEENFLKNNDDNFNLAVKNIFKDQFINTATENGIKRYEDMLKIIAKETEEIDVRRFRLFVRFNEKLPYTVPKLKEQLALLCGEDGYRLEIDVINFNIIVRIELKSKKMIEEAGSMLERMVPLNMCVDLDLWYNQHFKIGKFTHGFLQKYTHKSVRDEVLG